MTHVNVIILYTIHLYFDTTIKASLKRVKILDVSVGCQVAFVFNVDATQG